MGIKFNTQIQKWEAFVSKRNPFSGQPVSIRKRCETRSIALRAEKELLIRLNEKFYDCFPKWKDIVQTYTATKYEQGEWSSKTQQNYYTNLASHTFHLWGNRLADEINTQEIRDLIRNDLNGYSESHKKSVLKFIRGAFNFAVDSGILDRNPVPKIHFRVGDKIKLCLTLEQVKKFLEAAKELENPWYYHWTIALYTGMRNGELYALKWEKVNLENNFILVDSSWNAKDGFKSTKSGDDRIVEIAPNLSLILKELKLLRPDDVFVLPRVQNWDRGIQANELRKFLLGIGLPSIRFHDLRATWATLMLTKGTEPIKVMKMGGWKDLKTMEIYIRKAGVDIKGITSDLDLHNPRKMIGEVIQLKS